MTHHENCDVNDTNPDGIKKPCNCGVEQKPLCPLPAERVKCMVLNYIQHMPTKSFVQPLWGVVAELTGYGSTMATQLCREIGFDPHQNVAHRKTKLRELSKSADTSPGYRPG